MEDDALLRFMDRAMLMDPVATTEMNLFVSVVSINMKPLMSAMSKKSAI
jgi:hypothetical protein